MGVLTKEDVLAMPHDGRTLKEIYLTDRDENKDMFYGQQLGELRSFRGSRDEGSYQVVEKFLAACQYTTEHHSFDNALDYVLHSIERMQCFYRGLTKQQTFSFDVRNQPTINGNLVVQVSAPDYSGRFSTRMNLLVMYRIEKINKTVPPPETEVVTEQATEEAPDEAVPVLPDWAQPG